MTFCGGSAPGEALRRWGQCANGHERFDDWLACVRLNGLLEAAAP